jgi:hypothetical protein
MDIFQLSWRLERAFGVYRLPTGGGSNFYAFRGTLRMPFFRELRRDRCAMDIFQLSWRLERAFSNFRGTPRMPFFRELRRDKCAMDIFQLSWRLRAFEGA